MNLMEAIGGISDRHIEEFAYINTKKRRFKHWIIASAACLTVIIAVIAAVPVIKNNIEIYPKSSGNSGQTNVVPPDRENSGQSGIASSIEGNSENKPNNDKEQTDGVFPHIYFNDRIYSLYGHSENDFSELPEGYIQVGTITTNDRNNSKVNGYGSGPKVGEKIYQHPDFPEDVYVYTTLFTGGEYYRYLLFTDTTFYRVRINGKTYVWNYSHSERYLKSLPDKYTLVGEVTTNDRADRYGDGYGQSLNIGDKIYCSDETPDVVYVCTNEFLNDYYYVRFIVLDE